MFSAIARNSAYSSYRFPTSSRNTSPGGSLTSHRRAGGTGLLVVVIALLGASPAHARLPDEKGQATPPGSAPVGSPAAPVVFTEAQIQAILGSRYSAYR